MTNDLELPDLSQSSRAATEGRTGPSRGRGLRRYRLRTWSMAVVVAAVWLGVVLDPIVGPAVMGAVGGLALGVLIVLGALALCWLGFGLLALVERAVAWVRHVSRWPE